MDDASLHEPAIGYGVYSARLDVPTRAHVCVCVCVCVCSQCTDHSNYCGEYLRGKRHGYGVYTFPNGDKYAGEIPDAHTHTHTRVRI